MALLRLPRLLPRLTLFYARRLRRQWIQELLAGIGIAIGVALVLAVLISNGSITGSARQAVEGIAGTADLQLAARDGRSLDDDLLTRVRALPGVEHAAPVLEQRATIRYGRRRTPVLLVGVDRTLPQLGGSAASNYQLGGLILQPGIFLPAAVGDALDLPPSRSGGEPVNVALEVRGRSVPTPVGAVVGEGVVGPLAESIFAVASLPYAQQLAGLPGAISRVLIVTEPGQHDRVRDELATLGGDGLLVATVDNEIELLDQAAGPMTQATALFAAIGAIVGLLFAFNAMLLTVPDRRRFIATLRKLGFRRGKIVQILGFQAIVLGTVASLVGIAGGYLIANRFLIETPTSLTWAFPLGVHTTVPWLTVLAAGLGGVAATCLAAAQPLLDLRRGRSIEASLTENGEYGNALSRPVRRTLGAGAIALVAIGTAIALFLPAFTLVAAGALALATVLAIPTVLATVLNGADRAVRRTQARRSGGRGNMLLLAVRELRVTTIRSLALAATGAVAVFGSVAIDGAHRNLVTGLDRTAVDYLGGTDLWVTPGGDDNILTTQPIAARRTLEEIRTVPGVRDARPYFGGFVDLPDRRAWVIGRPAADPQMVPPSQLQDGDLTTVNARLREGGWVALSDAIADDLDARIGDTVALPTPTGERTFRLAGTLSNLGWGPGAIVMRADDFRTAWQTDDPTAIEVDVEPGATPAAVKLAIEDRIGDPALQVQTTPQRLAQFNALAREGMERLADISNLALVAAALAMAAAMGAALVQRRITLSRRRIQGFTPKQLRRILLHEAVIVLGTGCITGAALGIYGHVLAARYLHASTGYPAPFSFALPQTIETALLVLALALAITAIPAYLVSRTTPLLAARVSAAHR